MNGFDKPPLNEIILKNILKQLSLSIDEADPYYLSEELGESFSNCEPERITSLLSNMDRPIPVCKSAANIDFNLTSPVEFYIAGILSEGLSMLTAPAKGGKSRLLLQMALALCNGSIFLNRQCKKVSVLYLPLEDARVDFENRLKLFLDGKDPPANLYYLTGEDFNYQVPTLEEGQLIPLLEKNLKLHPDIKVILIDVFGIIRSKRGRAENFTDHERRDLQTLIQFVSKHRIAMVVAHHISKTGQRASGLKAIGSGAGSYVISGTIHAEMMISPQLEHGARYFSLEGRRIPSQKFALIDDFPKWKCGGTKEEFLSANDPIVQAVRILCEEHGGTWTGSGKQLAEANPQITSCISRKTFTPTVIQRLSNAGFSYKTIKNGSGFLHRFSSIKS